MEEKEREKNLYLQTDKLLNCKYDSYVLSIRFALSQNTSCAFKLDPVVDNFNYLLLLLLAIKLVLLAHLFSI